MNLGKYEAIGNADPATLATRYRELRDELQRLGTAPVKDMHAIDAVLVELDEVHAGLKRAQKLDSDPQRF